MRNITLEELNTIDRIVTRANDLGIAIGSRCTQHMDMDFATQQFHIDLDAMLNADVENFAHDFCGIQRHMNRITCRVEDFFLPRFARHESEVK